MCVCAVSLTFDALCVAFCVVCVSMRPLALLCYHVLHVALWDMYVACNGLRSVLCVAGVYYVPDLTGGFAGVISVPPLIPQ